MIRWLSACLGTVWNDITERATEGRRTAPTKIDTIRPLDSEGPALPFSAADIPTNLPPVSRRECHSSAIRG
jgi:hypothetical protein